MVLEAVLDAERDAFRHTNLSFLIPGRGVASGEGTKMKDMRAYLEKLRCDAAECAIIRDLATDIPKRELFSRLAEHFSLLASVVEREIESREPPVSGT